MKFFSRRVTTARFAATPYIKDAYKGKLDVHYVLGVINSRLIAHAYNALVKEAGRVFPQVKLTHVKKLPMAVAEKTKQKDIADLVKRILAAKARDASADVSALEREIDQLVYALYGLTPEEIKIVEEASKLFLCKQFCTRAC